MPNALSPDTTSWTKTGGLHVEPRLTALGFRHGVTTRALGNMKDAALRRKAVELAGLASDPFILNQVHGTSVVETSSVAGVPDARPTADGWITAERGAVAAIYIADCVPVFVWDRQGTAAGVFHAGWRGMAAGMPRAAVRAFRRFGLGPERLSAAVGPCAGPCCYAVGPEVRETFRPEVVRAGKLDLPAEARLQLLESNIPASDISVSGACTVCAPDEFFSYRRDKQDQRMMAFISIPEHPCGA
ncbi:MAG: peptidoglycan editing factor PgeF [Elusimicrobia bacterium]|nr:peptidoglycan editing factor PgeF [Elusimicrobiota bacterium]